jgi:hypothetical protein
MELDLRDKLSLIQKETKDDQITINLIITG